MEKAGQFNDQLVMGGVSSEQMAAFAMFGRNYYAQLRKDPNDVRALREALKQDISLAESGAYGRKWSRQYVAQRLGAEELLASLDISEAQEQSAWADTRSQMAVQARAQRAAEIQQLGRGAGSRSLAYFSKNKIGSVGGLITGGLAGAATLGLKGAAVGSAMGTILPGIGNIVGGAVGAGIGLALGGLGGAFAGSFIEDMFSPNSESSMDGLELSSTINVNIDADAARILREGESYTWYRDNTLTATN